MTTVVHQSNYIPWRGYFYLINKADVFVFYDEVQYTKNDWRNRNIIYTKNGHQWLTIPMSSTAVKQKISEASIEDDKWQNLHYKSLLLGYKSAPFFFQLEEIIEDYLLNKNWHNLSDLNQYLIKRICEKIGIKTKIINSTDFILKDGKRDRLLYLLEQIECSLYLTGPSAKDYLVGFEDEFKERGIEIDYLEYPLFPEYKQLKEPFEQNVSILDLIANVDINEILPKYINIT
jgi:hypothetical protein